MKKIFSILFFLALSFLTGHFVCAADVVDQSQLGGSNVLYWSSGWRVVGQAINPTHNNISRIDINVWDSSGTNSASSKLTLCKGDPTVVSQADVETNAPTCGWAGSIFLGQVSPAAASGSDGYYYHFEFATPLYVDDILGDYYFVLTFGDGTNHYQPRYNPATTGMLLNDNTRANSLNYRTYYDDTYSPQEIHEVYPTEGIYYSDTQPQTFAYSYIDPTHAFYNAAFYFINQQTNAQYSKLVIQPTATSSESTTFKVNLPVGIYSWQAALVSTSTPPAYILAPEQYHFTVASSSYFASLPPLDWTQTPFPVSTSTPFSNSSTHDLACNSDQWASSSTLVVFGCHISEIGLNLMATIVKLASSMMNTAKNSLTNIFPFNLAVGFYNSWSDSENTGLPSGFAYIDTIGVDGSLYLPLPPSWTGVATSSSEVQIWGGGMFASGTAAGDFFAAARGLSTYLLWALFVFGLYNIGMGIYSELVSHTKKE